MVSRSTVQWQEAGLWIQDRFRSAQDRTLDFSDATRSAFDSQETTNFSQRVLGHRRRCDIVHDVRVVADTDVIVAAMRSPSGASAAILHEVRYGKVELLLSLPLAMEYEPVCLRPEHQSAAGLSEEEARVFVDAVIAMAEEVRIHFLWRPQLRDPTDEMVLEAAVNGQAQWLITFNVHDYGTAPSRFGFQVMTPRLAMARIKEKG